MRERAHFDQGQVGESLVAYGAPVLSWKPQRHMPLSTALARGILLAKTDATLLSVLPVLVARADRNLELDLDALLDAAKIENVESEMGMLLALTSELTSNTKLGNWSNAFPKRNGFDLFLDTDRMTRRLQNLAEQQTPRVVREWGFLMNAPYSDFEDRIRKFV